MRAVGGPPLILVSGSAALTLRACAPTAVAILRGPTAASTSLLGQGHNR
jgi:hypothetical protein